MDANVLATQGARALASMILTMLNQINSLSAHEGLISFCIFMIVSIKSVHVSYMIEAVNFIYQHHMP